MIRSFLSTFQLSHNNVDFVRRHLADMHCQLHGTNDNPVIQFRLTGGLEMVGQS